MSNRGDLDVMYVYDGSFIGFLCCVFESYHCGEMPQDIVPDDMPRGFLYPVKQIITDHEKAKRVYVSLTHKIKQTAVNWLKVAFLAGVEGKELTMFHFIRLGYQIGPPVVTMLTHGTVHAVYQMVRAVQHESRQFFGFIRFAEYQQTLVSIIEPKHFVLPLIQKHFCHRYPDEQFLIYDQTHAMVLVYDSKQANIMPLDKIKLPETHGPEQKYQSLWQQYYKVIAIEARLNPQCRRSHMPKRFWRHITELEKEILTSQLAVPPATTHQLKQLKCNT